MATKISIEQFIQDYHNKIVIDVRSPVEYNHAHIPGAINIPLFSDDERKEVGTIYKEQGRQVAIKKGLDFFGPKMKSIVEIVEQKMGESKNNPSDIDFNRDAPHTAQHPIIVHCARGGMRSAAIAWLLDLYGFKVYVIVGGYKAFRNWVLKQFEIHYHFKILGGFTGSKKTTLLKELKESTAVIDLEALAHHKGSTFGGFNQPKQTSNELFENKLALSLFPLRDKDTIWLEDESRQIGFNQIPNGIWHQMREAQVYFLEIPFEERLENIVQEYGDIDVSSLMNATKKIKSQLGGLETKNTIQFLEEGNKWEAFAILLKYYDKFYRKGLDKRVPSTILRISKEAFLKTVI
jgi:tRNA 2-selenouridine synthase